VTIRVVLGEDNVLVREGVRALLDSYDDIEVVGVAEDAPTLLATAAEHEPDVVVTDIKMPPSFQLEGIDCAHQIRSSHPDTGVVVLSAHDDEAYALALLGGGHSGLAYLLKDRIAQGDELVRAIREVHAGGSAVDPVIAERLSGRSDTAGSEQELLDMMAKGLGYVEMAAALGTTQEAVDRQVTELFQRMAGDGEHGSSRAVDGLKRLHEAVVKQSAAATAFRSFVPPQVAERLAAAGAAGLREELEATILFSDIRGSVTIAERLSPGEMAELIARHLTAMSEVIVAHGGLVDQFVGDAVMAVFGAPESIDDHAERALRCAIAMQVRQSELNAALMAAGSPELGVGIGVNTGRVSAGTVGGVGRMEYTVTGDVVNVAARLQSLAPAGQIVASAATARAARAIPCESIGPHQVKGREEPVEVFRVIARA
jgi:class 3 adenylate cyclase/ActR/RegA family two-component response regulator